MRRSLVLFLFVLCVGAGCGDARKAAPRGMFAVQSKDGPAQAPMARDEAEHAIPKNDAPAGGAGNPVAAPAKEFKVDQPRKIKYSADLRVVVTDFDKAWQGLRDAVKDAKGFSAKEDIQGSAGAQRTGTWTIRIPVEQIHPFREAIVKLGKADRNNLTSEDITADYYDLVEHIKNKEVEREAVRKLLEKTGDRDLNQFFTVKRELDQITDHINRMEGKRRLWANLADLSTVTVHLREVQRFDDADKKPAEREEPSFGQRADRAWTSTVDLFVGFWQWVALVAIFVAPWLPIPIVLFVGLWLSLRVLLWLTRKRPSAQAAPMTAEVVVAEETPKKKARKEDQPEAE